MGFAEFLQCDFHLMHEISAGLGTLRLTIVKGW